MKTTRTQNLLAAVDIGAVVFTATIAGAANPLPLGRTLTIDQRKSAP